MLILYICVICLSKISITVGSTKKEGLRYIGEKNCGCTFIYSFANVNISYVAVTLEYFVYRISSLKEIV